MADVQGLSQWFPIGLFEHGAQKVPTSEESKRGGGKEQAPMVWLRTQEDCKRLGNARVIGEDRKKRKGLTKEDLVRSSSIRPLSSWTSHKQVGCINSESGCIPFMRIHPRSLGYIIQNQDATVGLSRVSLRMLLRIH